MEQHVTALIPDYILGLLTQSERRVVESHAATCGLCQRALEDERAFESLIRQSLMVATQPSAGLLQRTRPATLPRRQTAHAFLARQLAPVMLLLAILAGTLALQTTRTTGRLDLTVPAFYRANTPTATSTSTPTATITGLPFSVPATAISMTQVTLSDVAPTMPQVSQTAATTTEVRLESTPVVTANSPATN